jgi:hypothetical protein
MLDLKPWTQFFDLKGRTDLPVSSCDRITMRNLDLKCDQYMDAKASEKYRLTNFLFQNVKVATPKPLYDTALFKDAIFRNVQVVPAVKQ